MAADGRMSYSSMNFRGEKSSILRSAITRWLRGSRRAAPSSRQEFPYAIEGNGRMETPNSVIEEDLDTAFREGPEFGVQYLDSEHRGLIFRHIKRAGRGFLNPAELMDIYQETILGVIKKTSEPGFDPCRSLRMVFAIARNKAINALRARRKLRINEDYDAILNYVAADTKDTNLGLRWKAFVGPAEAKELREILSNFIPSLPLRQRVVAQCFIDNFEDYGERRVYIPLARAVSAVTGITESVADVKCDWRYAREKIVNHLQGLGYDVFKGE